MTCSCAKVQNGDNFSKCPVCLLQLNGSDRLPFALGPEHNIICLKCLTCLHPEEKSSAVLQRPLMRFIGIHAAAGTGSKLKEIENGIQSLNISEANIGLTDEALSLQQTGEHLMEIANISKSTYFSRSLIKKVANLLIWFCPNGQLKIISKARSLGNRILYELLSHNQVSNYQAQQQLWSAIRSKSCQFTGPALQDEAIKMVHLALEDAALSRKVLIGFVVQRLNPQFPQATKTSIGHVIQLLYRSGCFRFLKEDAENVMTLKEEYKTYEALREAHDDQIIRIGLEAGLHFNSEQWSHILYRDNLHKPQMQSIIDKLVKPQSFSHLATELLIAIQRVYDEETAELLRSVHPRFVELAAVDCATVESTWSNAEKITGLATKTFKVLALQKISLQRGNARR